MPKNKYVVISPCRNEEKYMRHTLDSVLHQTVKPDLWVIVNDGSTDGTSQILAEYADKHSCIKIVNRCNRGHRSVGPGVIEAFYEGYGTIDMNQYDFLCKLDLDLNLPPSYFEILLQRMDDNPRIGTCSGKAYYLAKPNGNLVSEKCGDENSVGMTKFYRKECFQQIGSFVRQVMWDGIDGHRCRMLGWIACSWDDPDLRFTHLRPMGSSQQNWLTGRMRHGFGQYFMGTSFFYMTTSALFRMSRPPYIIGGLAMWWGYIRSWLTGRQRYDDTTFRTFLRKYHLSCLLHGKEKATATLNERQATIWQKQ